MAVILSPKAWVNSSVIGFVCFVHRLSLGQLSWEGKVDSKYSQFQQFELHKLVSINESKFLQYIYIYIYIGSLMAGFVMAIRVCRHI